MLVSYLLLLFVISKHPESKASINLNTVNFQLAFRSRDLSNRHVSSSFRCLLSYFIAWCPFWIGQYFGELFPVINTKPSLCLATVGCVFSPPRKNVKLKTTSGRKKESSFCGAPGQSFSEKFIRVQKCRVSGPGIIQTELRERKVGLDLRFRPTPAASNSVVNWSKNMQHDWVDAAMSSSRANAAPRTL